MKPRKILGMIGIALLFSVTLLTAGIAAEEGVKESLQPQETYVLEKNSSSALQIPPPYNDPSKWKAVEPPIPKVVDPESEANLGTVSYNSITGEIVHSAAAPDNRTDEPQKVAKCEGFQGSYEGSPQVARMSEIFQSFIDRLDTLFR